MHLLTLGIEETSSWTTWRSQGRDDTEQVAQGCGTVYDLEMIVIETLIQVNYDYGFCLIFA
jgi:hypothetical protein